MKITSSKKFLSGTQLQEHSVIPTIHNHFSFPIYLYIIWKKKEDEPNRLSCDISNIFYLFHEWSKTYSNIQDPSSTVKQNKKLINKNTKEFDMPLTLDFLEVLIASFLKFTIYQGL